MWRMTRRSGGSSRGIVVVVGVVEGGAVEVVGGAQVRGGRPYFFDPLIPCPKLDDPCPAINDPYNICIN